MAETWESLFRKWLGRLMYDRGWVFRFTATCAVSDDADAEVKIWPEHREAEFLYRPDSVPNNVSACHEVCHILTTRMDLTAQGLVAQLGDPQGLGKMALDGACEQVTHDLVRLFLRIYEEEGKA